MRELDTDQSGEAEPKMSQGSQGTSWTRGLGSKLWLPFERLYKGLGVWDEEDKYVGSRVESRCHELGYPSHNLSKPTVPTKSPDPLKWVWGLGVRLKGSGGLGFGV